MTRPLHMVIAAIIGGDDISNADARALLDDRAELLAAWFNVSDNWARLAARLDPPRPLCQECGDAVAWIGRPAAPPVEPGMIRRTVACAGCGKPMTAWRWPLVREDSE